MESNQLKNEMHFSPLKAGRVPRAVAPIALGVKGG
jgi:hypothetical protein